jgi:thiol-disulfide isomerase/thioredoxin
MNTIFKLFIIALSIPAYSFGQQPVAAGSTDTTKTDSLLIRQNIADLERAKKRFLQDDKDTGRGMTQTELQAQMTNDPAPEFSLYDTDGKLVTLKSLKGKVIVLDFWATWCVPCLASFPAMQHVEDEYKTDKEVVFLYINTRERNKDIQSWISDFQKEHAYSFRMLLDKESKVAASFKATGLPTKVIIDKNGSIRFTATAYSGYSALIHELPAMIELTKK